MREKWEQRWSKSSSDMNSDTSSGSDWHARKEREQAEIDAILDKIRKSGYDSLTREEKQRLFEYRDR